MQNVFEQFAWAADRHPARIAIEVQRQDHLESVSYARVREMAERTAAWLSLIGVGAGARCAIVADNDVHWCAAYLGILRLGAVAVPLDTAYQPPQIATLLHDCGAGVCFTTLKYLDTLRAAMTAAVSQGRIVLLHGEAPGTVSFEGMVGARMPAPPLRPCPSRPDDMAVILYTSGTTSDPKGVVLTHGNLLAERTAVFGVVRVDERDCVLGVLPLFHSLAQMANLLLPLSVGARVVFLETVNTTELVRALRERGVTVFACVPQFFYLIQQRVLSEIGKSGLVTRNLFRLLLCINGGARRAGVNAGPMLFSRVHALLGGRMRLMIAGGARLDPAVGADLYRLGFNILQAYGLAETSGAATLSRPGDAAVNTVGPPLPGVEVRIAPRETAEQTEHADGEVLICGPMVMQGYYNRPDATAAALRGGWLHTGDLGRLDARGRLSITGRSKEVIVVGSGKNIYPEEIEAVYRQSPFIKEVCVLGLSHPREPAGERLYAVVVPDHEVLRERRIANIGDLLRFEMEGASVYLPAHKRVLGYEIWNERLPRTTTGKVKRFEVEHRVRAGIDARATSGGPALSEADREWLDREDIAPVIEVIAASRPGAVIGPDSNLELDLGLDSMERVELLTALEHRLGADIPEEEMQHLHSVRQVAETLLAHACASTPSRAGAMPWASLLAPEASDQAALRQWLEPHWIVPGLVFLGIKLVRLLLRPGVRVRLEGGAQFPRRGPFLICPNHQSYLDPFFVVAALPYRLARQVFYVGASEYFETPLLRWLARQVNLAPVDPDAGLVSAMQAGAAGLRAGRVLLLFPEGERSIDGEIRHVKKGAAILAHHVGVPIVPVAIDGAFAIWPRNRPLNWRALLPGAGTTVTLRAGAPLPPPSADSRESAYATATARLRAAIVELAEGMGTGLRASDDRADVPGSR